MAKEFDSSAEGDLIDRLFDVPGEANMQDVIERPIFPAPKVNPFYINRNIRGGNLFRDLINRARKNPDSYYHTLSELDKGIMELVAPLDDDQESLSFSQAGQQYGLKKSSVGSKVNRIRAKIIGEIKLE